MDRSSGMRCDWVRIWQISIRIRSPSVTASNSSFTSSNNLRKAATNNIAVKVRVRRKTHHVVADAPGLEDAPGAVHVGAHLRTEADLVEQRVDQVASAALALAHRPAPPAGGLVHCFECKLVRWRCKLFRVKQISYRRMSDGIIKRIESRLNKQK